MNRVKKFAFGTGLILNAIGVFLFLLFWGLTTNKLERIGWYCPGACSPGYNATGMDVDYPRVIKLNSAEPIKIKTFIYHLQPEELGCTSPKNGSTTVNYDATLLTSGLDLSPSSSQKTNDLVNIERAGDSVASWVWIVHPKEPGTYSFHAQVLAQVENCTVSKLSNTFQIQVVNLFGLNTLQLQVFSLLGLIFGTSLTVPGFIALWIQYKDRKEAKEKKKSEEKQSKRKVKLAISSSGEEKEIEVDDEIQG